MTESIGVKVIHLYIKKVVYEEHKELEKEVVEITIKISKLTEEKDKLNKQDDGGAIKD